MNTDLNLKTLPNVEFYIKGKKCSAWVLANHREAGMTLKNIGKEYGVTRERIRQLIVEQLGSEWVSFFNTLDKKFTADKKAREQQRVSSARTLRYGVSSQAMSALKDLYGKALLDRLKMRYANTKNMSWRTFGDKDHFQITLEEYVKLLQDYSEKQFPSLSKAEAMTECFFAGKSGLTVFRVDKEKPFSSDNLTIVTRQKSGSFLGQTYGFGTK